MPPLSISSTSSSLVLPTLHSTHSTPTSTAGMSLLSSPNVGSNANSDHMQSRMRTALLVAIIVPTVISVAILVYFGVVCFSRYRRRRRRTLNAPTLEPGIPLTNIAAESPTPIEGSESAGFRKQHTSPSSRRRTVDSWLAESQDEGDVEREYDSRPRFLN